ncbi:MULTISPECIES: hypothetical protein [Xanthomonas]|uniref:hypothetical protein n=1 Tax=Xanthomonas TaxID=338 RepID=UPI001ADD5CDD|nr:hypothetical protein [Xanthomonas phaseoli]MBO9768120.1 hypothetical protein [Xanthomonas phaseoli pv. dieffenbachiae]MBO9776406.1 hypothetical protein [Xanthomonas phaseoli pv. dieffenbachiae]MBO9778691.1 hypothetical protein [Xanthomonas phaseoli pv. dieffenbachiae]MBO9797879.1 hypothetical protein [Xanthomonas phaseoli pv. dieffenbachiae]MBO9799337.1 hypothetical protein [Xanthomonas phaseoli pv. dieffenbachiae]
MTQLQIVVLTAMVGPAYLIFLCLIGDMIGRAWLSTIESSWERGASTMLAGLLAHAALTSVALVVAPGWSGMALWILLAGAVISWRWRRPMAVTLAKPLLLVIAYSVACYLVLLSFHYGPARGSTIFWSIFSLTNVTPGDSPQSAFQAQYLLFGHQLIGAQQFALFDRPFLGGIITAGTLPAFGIHLQPKFYDYDELTAFAYTNLWISINSIAALSLLNVVERFSNGRSTLIISMLLLASPFLVFNTIGLWPKLLALSLICLACTQALRKNWIIAILLSGASFVAHGSFLWAHLSFGGALILILLAQRQKYGITWPRLAAVPFACAAVPIAWFVAEHLVGGATPLRTYYLYNVQVAYGLDHTAEQIAKEFYSSTNPANLAVLPWMNMIKGILPIETLDAILNYRLSNEAISWRTLGETLFYTQHMRTWFALGLIGGIVTLRGLLHSHSERWLPRLALIVFFVLPLIPGLGLYRRDDLFLLIIMMFSAIPVLISFSIGFSSLREPTMTAIALAMIAEYLMIYFWRYPPGSYAGEFHAYYLAVIVPSLLIVAASIVWPRKWQPSKLKIFSSATR